MLFAQFCVIVSVAILAAAAAPSAPSDPAAAAAPAAASVQPEEASGDTYDLGVLSPNSVLIHTDVFTDRSFRWLGNNAISRVEIRNSGSGLIGPVTVRGGLNDDFVQIVRTNANPINAIVKIYSTPNNQTFGSKSVNFVLVHSERVQGHVPVDMNYTDPENGHIRYIEIVDQTNGVGSSAKLGIPLGLQSTQITFDSQLVHLPIDYIVNVYALPFLLGQKGLSLGDMTENSQYIGNQTVTLRDLDTTGRFQYTSKTHLLDFARFTDLTVDNLGRIMSGRIGYRTTIDAQFNTHATETRYLLQIYGQLRAPPDVIVGELLPTSKLLDSNTIYANGTARANHILNTVYPIDRIEVLNQNGNVVTPELVVGEVGGNLVLVLFDAADERQIIHFRVNVYGRLNA